MQVSGQTPNGTVLQHGGHHVRERGNGRNGQPVLARPIGLALDDRQESRSAGTPLFLHG